MASRAGHGLHGGNAGPRGRDPAAEEPAVGEAAIRPRHAPAGPARPGVGADPEVPLLIQGHPGTGKTIIAAYRAAHLTDPDRAGGSVAEPSARRPDQGVRRPRPRSDRAPGRPLEGPRGGDGGHPRQCRRRSRDSAVARSTASQTTSTPLRVVSPTGGEQASGGWGIRTAPRARNANLAAVYERFGPTAPGRRRCRGGRQQVDWMSRLPPYRTGSAAASVPSRCWRSADCRSSRRRMPRRTTTSSWTRPRTSPRSSGTSSTSTTVAATGPSSGT